MAITLVQAPNLISSDRNQMGIIFQADPAWASHDSYAVSLDIGTEDVISYYGGVYTAMNLDIRLYPDSDGLISVDISALLREFIPDREPPTWDSALNPFLNNSSFRYQIETTEIIDGVDQTATIPLTGFICNRSGMNFKDHQGLQAWAVAGKFLTHHPRVKKVRTWQPEWLSYLATTTAQNIQGMVDIIHEDGTITTYQPPNMTYGPEPGQVLSMAVGYDQLNLEAQATDIVGWKAYIVDSSDEVLSEKFEFRLAPILHDLDRYYLFENSLGGWDVLRTTGKLTKHSLQATSLQGVKTLALGYDPADGGNYFRENVQHHETFTQSTGLGEDADTVAWLRDLVRSQKVYRVGPHRPNIDGTLDTSGYTEILITSTTAELTIDEAYEYGIEFSFREAFINVGL